MRISLLPAGFFIVLRAVRMTLRFVKTAILSSNDGIDFGTEVAVESEEVFKARVAAEAASTKPLYQQLADLRDLKKLEYDENTKKIFAPPKGLDEDDIEFFNEMDSAKARVDDSIKRRDDMELEAFRESRRVELLKENSTTSAATIKLPTKKVEPTINSGVTVKAKRRLQASAAEDDSLPKKKVAECEKTVPPAVAVAQKVVTAPAEAKEPSSLFADYDSD